jgi:hypothetical protein
MAFTYPACPLPRPLGLAGLNATGGASGSRSFPSCTPPSAYVERGHQREKLEFALAVAVSRGDHSRVESLRTQIADLADEGEEPGT